MATKQFVKLNSGYYMPQIGLGTWQSKPNEVTAAVITAIEAGYRHIDCARVYENEAEVGAAIKAKIADGTVKREDLFITTKLWNNSHRRDLVLPALKQSLSDLGLSYVDMYLIHWPISFTPGDNLFPSDSSGKPIYDDGQDLSETWKGMEELVSLGLAKSIGVSNFNRAQIEQILSSCSIPPGTNQIELHPYFPQEKMLEFCKSKGIVVTAYSPFSSPGHMFAKASDPVLLQEPKLIEIGKKYGKGPNHVVLQWHLQKGVVAIPKSVTKSRIIDNVNFSFKLTDEEMKTISSLNRGALGRKAHVDIWKESKAYPFNDEF